MKVEPSTDITQTDICKNCLSLDNNLVCKIKGGQFVIDHV